MGNQKRHLVTGGAGFLGSHLIDKLMRRKENVICIDNLSTGNLKNIHQWIDHPLFEFIHKDINNEFDLKVDFVWHLASKASPFNYIKNPIESSLTNFLGTFNALNIAKRSNAKFIFTSSSEIYGFTKKFPLMENDWGIVNPNGVRSCYVEGKRIAESLTFDFQRTHGLNVCVARIFNTYGPRMRTADKRVISEFIFSALNNKNLMIFGDGCQTRSFCYVDDTVNGLLALAYKKISGPVNIGSSEEISINELAKIILKKIKSNSKIVYKNAKEDEPSRRCPSIDRINTICGWKPYISLDTGLDKTINILKTY